MEHLQRVIQRSSSLSPHHNCTYLHSLPRRSARTLHTSKISPDDFEVVIGIEMHVQIASKTKIFSDAEIVSSAEEGVHPNTRVSPTDIAHPGTLPTLNRYCVQQAIKAGLAFGSKINKWSAFDRKHYFYADLPHGYQITQLEHPIVEGGSVLINLNSEEKKSIRIERIQLEMDSGKSLHSALPSKSLLDFNRAGVGLLEIVTAPDMRSAREAAQVVRMVQGIVQAVGVSGGRMAEGELRCDANISVRPKGGPLGTRTEIKNLNSIRFLQKAIAERQKEILMAGGHVIRETRGFDAVAGTTFHLRSKEDEVDYRFMPEPDLPPLRISEEEIKILRDTLPELPEAKKLRMEKTYELTSYECELLEENGATPFFEAVVSQGRNAKRTASLILNNLFGLLNEEGKEMDTLPFGAEEFGALVDLLETNYISSFVVCFWVSLLGKVGQEVLVLMYQGDNRSPREIVEAHEWAQNSDEEALQSFCREVIAAHPEEVKKFKEGKWRMIRFLVGQAIQRSQGKGNPKTIDEIMRKLLE